MRKWVSFIAIIVCCSAGSPVSSVINQPFPEMQAETVDDKVISLPEDTKGRIPLVG